MSYNFKLSSLKSSFANYVNENRSSFSYLVTYDDGEGDDMLAIAILQNITQNVGFESTAHFVSYGNPDICHRGLDDNVEKELGARIRSNELTLFKKNGALKNNSHIELGAANKDSRSQAYLNALKEPGTMLVVHTASFTNLYELFTQANPGQLQGKVFLTYGSVNLDWVIPSPLKPQNNQDVEDLARYQREQEHYLAENRKFYDSIETSGATLVQIEGYPLLGKRNRITLETTPLSYSLLNGANETELARRLKRINDDAMAKIRKKQVEKIISFLRLAENNANTHQKQKIMQHIHAIIASAGVKRENNVGDGFVLLEKTLDQSFTPAQHSDISIAIGALVQYLKYEKIAGDEIDRSFNIYTGVSYHNQFMLADQIPALIAAEIIENRSGLMMHCAPVKLEGIINGRRKFSISDTSRVFYMDAAETARLTYPHLSGAELQNKVEILQQTYLDYMDFCMAVNFIIHPSLLSESECAKWLASEWGDKLLQQAVKIASAGFHLPACWLDLKDRIHKIRTDRDSGYTSLPLKAPNDGKDSFYASLGTKEEPSVSASGAPPDENPFFKSIFFNYTKLQEDQIEINQSKLKCLK